MTANLVHDDSVSPYSGRIRAIFGRDQIGSVVNGDVRYPASPEFATVRDPASGLPLASVARADIEVAAAAVEAAKSASATWRGTPGHERARQMLRVAAAIRAEHDELSHLESADTGKPLAQAARDVDQAARYFEFYAGMADKVGGETIPIDDAHFAYTLREPYGVVAHILPWNSPFNQLARGVAPSLAAGNTVVIKPAELAPLSCLYFGWLALRSGLPSGVVNVVSGPGPVVGDALVRHRDIGLVTFTGSVETGSAVLRAAAENITPCNLELGGKSATLIFPDCEMGAAVAAGVDAIRRNSGQSCFATTRLLVHDSIYDEYVSLLAAETLRLTLGPGLEDPDMGPLVSSDQLARVRGFVDEAVAEGARIAAGGSPAPDERLAGGYFFQPTVLAGVRNSMRVAREEIFGPVQCVITFSNEDEAVELANDSDYGLAAGIFTRDFSRVHRIARRLEAGQVQVNEYPAGGVETPFGGYKRSGMGREKGLEALRGYTQLKTVVARI